MTADLQRDAETVLRGFKGRAAFTSVNGTVSVSTEFIGAARRLAEFVRDNMHPTSSITSADIVDAFREFAEVSGDTWDGVDAQEYVRELRE